MRHFIKRLKTQHGLYLVLFLCLCALLWRTSSDLMKRRGPLWDKYERVQIGMTESQVRSVLGPDAELEYFGGGLSNPDLILKEGGKTLSVELYFGDGTVVRKDFRPRPRWEE